MRHSTGTPTKAEAERMAAIKSGPCVCCHMRGQGSVWPDVHHLLSGNRRRGHLFTIGLCAWHHRGFVAAPYSRQWMTERLGPSLAHGSKPFRAEFGSDDELLAYQDELLGLRAAA